MSMGFEFGDTCLTRGRKNQGATNPNRFRYMKAYRLTPERVWKKLALFPWILILFSMEGRDEGRRSGWGLGRREMIIGGGVASDNPYGPSVGSWTDFAGVPVGVCVYVIYDML
eukprot:1371244-Amorphochlora_amoeboformis.AAC.1